MSIFKACDIRGRYGDALTPEVARRLGQAIAAQLNAPTVLVAGDVRPSTEPLKDALVDGLVTAGCRVVDLGIVPTPAFYFARDHLGVMPAVMVTGSHNPPGDNGFKVNLGPWPITEPEIALLARRMESADPVSRTGGGYETRDILSDYESDLEQRCRPWRERPGGRFLKVAVDAGNGCYAYVAPRVMRALGVEVVELFCEPDGRFPNRHPNPAVAAHLMATSDMVVRSGADLGVAFDGDGDRAVFIDNLGRVVESDRSIVLFARHLLRERAGEVVYDLKCSSVVAEEVRRAGGTPLMEKSGHTFIKTTLLRQRAVLGGEISGHFFFGDLGRDDGLYAALLMAHLVAVSGRPMAALVDSVPRYPITPDLRLACPPDVAQAIVRDVERAFRERTECAVSTLDGVRVAWPDGWALVRVSVTEPVITLRFEAHTDARLAEIQQAVRDQVPALARLFSRS
jgi:phosphomannomutase/phosphoglucomutase